ncbi:hypothetical protein BMW22_14625 [Rhizobium leguminosarum]|uniref:Uncharacterized protein n=1 Tax=Rhizobium leguminosarum TaxID=384 RepID=A0A1L3ZAH1_RHILE|nr:hypothetical protein [Rhizobium leguminosarum]API52686.1 hypothetical protein BMW22_14625 [Rhizobium leguminosarum]
MRDYFYSQLRRYIGLFVLGQNSVVEIDPTTPLLIGKFPQGKVTFRSRTQPAEPVNEFDEYKVVKIEDVTDTKPDYLVISGLIHYERDIQSMFAQCLFKNGLRARG